MLAVASLSCFPLVAALNSFVNFLKADKSNNCPKKIVNLIYEFAILIKRKRPNYCRTGSYKRMVAACKQISWHRFGEFGFT